MYANLILYSASLSLFIGSCYAENVSQQILEPLFFFESSNETNNLEMQGLSINDKHDIFFRNGPHNHISYFYSNFNMLGEAVNITEFVNNHLLQIGYKPISWYAITEPKPWESSYRLNYGVYPSSWPKNIDGFGNVLLTFSYDGCKRSINRSVGQDTWLEHKLGVWHKDFGFKVLVIHEISDVLKTFVEGDYLFVQGFDETHNHEKLAVISIADGYWGERKQPEPEPINPVVPMQDEPIASEKTIVEPHTSLEPDEKTQTSWWGRHKPTWWP